MANLPQGKGNLFAVPVKHVSSGDRAVAVPPARALDLHLALTKERQIVFPFHAATLLYRVLSASFFLHKTENSLARRIN